MDVQFYQGMAAGAALVLVGNVLGYCLAAWLHRA